MSIFIRASALGLGAMLAMASATFAQQSATHDAPILYTPDMAMGSGPGDAFEANYSPGDMNSAEETRPLPIDLFTSKDFYQDAASYTDPRYYRCMDPASIEGLAQAGVLDKYKVEDLPWGYCKSGTPLEQLVSPYAFTTAADHWAAIVEEVKSHGGPTKHTATTLPDWSGVWVRLYEGRTFATDISGPGGGFQPEKQLYPYWMWTNVQASTLASVLTPKYQQYMVQDLYHDAHNRAVNWPLTYCWPEGYLRWFTGTVDPILMTNTPDAMTFLGQGVNSSIRVIYNDRQFKTGGAGAPNLTGGPPQWYGESIGMWDGDTYYVWTSNVQGWVQHQSFEYSSNMQTIEIYSRENRNDGHLWLKHETIFYDSEALVKPLRQIISWKRINYKINLGRPYTFNECLQNIFPVNGVPSQVPSGQQVTITVTDYFGRPWAKISEDNFEQNMKKPDDDSFLLDALK
jgi:hypothetical protein